MSIDIKIPTVGESITEVEIGEWLKSEGDFVSKDEVLAVIETEKATVDLPAPESGTLSEIIKKSGEGAMVGDVIGRLNPGSGKAKSGSTDKSIPVESKSEEPSPKHENEAGTPPRIMPAAQSKEHCRSRFLRECGLRRFNHRSSEAGRGSPNESSTSQGR